MARLRGLRKLAGIKRSEGLLLRPCAQVHTFGLRFAIDVVFCDADLRVIHLATLRPRRVSRYVRGAKCCIEMAAGCAAGSGIEPGTQLAIAEAPA
jgi:uncharacterized membrane protein (UPF0127 family)